MTSRSLDYSLVPSGVDLESRTYFVQVVHLKFRSLDEIAGMERKIKDLHKSCESMSK